MVEHQYLFKYKLQAINPSPDPFTAKDATWRPRGITNIRICLSACYNFYYAFQQPVC